MNIESLLKILFDNTTLIAIFFAVGGLVKLFTYYKLFGIHIFEFIDIKEVVILFVNNLFGYFLVFGVIAIALIKLPILETFKYTIPVIFSVGSVVYFISRKKVLFVDLLTMNILFWLLFIIVGELLLAIDSSNLAFEKMKNYTLLILFSSLIVYSIANAFTEFYKVKHKFYYSGTKIIYALEEFASTNEKYYIGKTEKFIFIYDSCAKTTEAIMSSGVKKIIFKTK